ncbi:MAG: nickel-dependent hydrogenase large subunit [Candidatus Beckwithbacteria bacterium]
MHQINLDLSLKEICKIEGGASLDLSIKNNKVTKCHFKITEYKRFYTQAIKGKPALAAPALLARICGTCSNAHILAAIEAVEQAFKIIPSKQTQTLRRLINNGLIIRDHALHLYIFVLPDLFNQDSLLDFDEKDPHQHQLLHDTFDVKDAGNQLSILTGGRSVHAPLPMVGGFTKFPEKTKTKEVIAKLQAIRPAVLRLIKIFANSKFHQLQQIPYLAIKDPTYSYILGRVISSDGIDIPSEEYRGQLEHKDLTYSQAAAYTYKQGFYMTGALARINLNKDALNKKTKQDTASSLSLFPSKNIHHNNLAQAIEILNAIDDSLEILTNTTFVLEPLLKALISTGTGFGVVEAPRGILYHRLTIENNLVKDAEILVPTGQNQLNIQNDIKILVDSHLQKGDSLTGDPAECRVGTAKLEGVTLTKKLRQSLEYQIEILIRAYDPCMSCAAHFLKINWK